MICANCRHPLKHVAAEVGRMKFGRICARRLGLIEQTFSRLPIPPGPPRDPLTPDLFADEEPRHE
jgi:hypothetical protein